ncbi:MAG TPA: carbon-nitrogen hydrolase family protein, partial [Bryobacteraceae bacterium]|nr:carbon-nitrogen hydrolase family protein [Bryobacteraceae bacterium]
SLRDNPDFSNANARRRRSESRSALPVGLGTGIRLLHHYCIIYATVYKGTGFPVASTQWGRWGTLICYDRQMPETARILAVKGAQLILVPAWGSYSELNDIMMRVRAYENGVWLAFVHPKRCLVIDPRGRIIAQNDREQDQIVTAQISTAKVRRVLLERRRPEIYGEILGQAKEK